jgi:drug/metabolite transporter (DMT)-like permease
MILIAFLYLVCASTFTISKAALQYVSPLFFIAARMLLAGSILLIYYRWRCGKSSIASNHLFLFAQVILFTMYGSYVLDIVALNYLTSAKACLLYDLSPFISVLMSYLWFGEVMTSKKWLGLIIGCLGFLPVFIASGCQALCGRSAWFSWPELVMYGAVFSSAYGWIVVRQLVKEYDYSPALINGVGMIGGGLLALVSSYFLEAWHPLPVNSVPLFIGYTILIVLVANILFLNLYSVLLKKYTATLLSLAGFTAPLFAALLGWFFLGERVTWEFFVTTIFVLVGLYLFYQEELRQGYINE